MPEKKDLATSGTEAFNIQGQTAKKSVVINIQEEIKPVILEKEQGTEQRGMFAKINAYFIAHSKVKLKDKANFFHLLSVMVNSGIPMIKSLRSLFAQLDKSPKMQSVVNDLSKAIERGSSLSEAMLIYPNVFSESEIGMIQSGEATGQLDKVLENLAEDAEKAYDIKSKVKSAMIYPAVVFALLIAVFVAMMVYVVPRLTELFENVDGELPTVTRIVVGVSDFMVENKLLMAVGTLAIFVFLTLFKKTDVGRHVFDTIKLKIPIFGPLFKKAYLARFARSLSNLIDSDVSIVRTIEITANSIGNDVYRKRLLLASEDIKQGIPLAENLTESPLFPPMLVNMIDVGEKTAQLDTITKKVAAFYESEVDTQVAGISKIIEPVILVVIGVTVGTVVAAIMLPIMKLSDLTGAV